MGSELPPEAYESGLDHHLSWADRSARAMNRRIFREMVKTQIEDRPLSRHRRRALVRFGRKLKMDSFETRLIIRGVEYECGHVAPAAMADVGSDVSTDFLGEHSNEIADERNRLTAKLLWPVMGVTFCILAWLLR